MKLGFRAKVLLSIIIISVLATTTVSMVLYQRAEQLVEQNFLDSLRARLWLEMDTIEANLKEAYDISLALQHDADFLKLVQEYDAGGKRDPVRALSISQYLQNEIHRNSMIENVYVYLPNRKQVITSDIYHGIQEIFVPEEYAWFTTPTQKTGLSPAFLKDTIRRLPQNTLSYIRPAYTDNLQMVIIVNVDESKLFYECMDRNNLIGVNRYFLAAPNGTVASASAMADIGVDLHSLLPAMNNLFDADCKELYVRNEELLAGVRSPMTDYRLVAVVDRQEVLHALIIQRRYIFYITFVVLLVFLALAFGVSSRVYQPVKQLRRAMEQVSRGDLSARAHCKATDEIGQLSDGFNRMVDQIEGLIGELVNERLQKKEAELEALQYQITPHFMYNTLNSIKYAAYLQGVQGLGDQLGAFIELLQASISRNGAFILLKDELRMVKNYIQLQNFRYMDQISVTYDIASGVEKYYVPRLLLQPLVENAILHGQNEGYSEIQISVITENGQLYLSVEDHGAGMTAEQISRLTDGKTKQGNGFSGIGIPNIIQRLQIYYGNRAELRYVPCERGTRVIIILPASSNPEEYQI